MRALSEDGRSLLFELDTGARESSIQEPIFDKLDLGPGESRRGFSIGAGGGESVTRLQVSDLSFILSGLLYRFEKISTRPASDNGRFVIADGRLGSDIAHDGVMIVDFQRGVFEIRK